MLLFCCCTLPLDTEFPQNTLQNKTELPHYYSVHIITDYGRPTGVALVELATPQDAAAAGAKDKAMMGSRYIEVFPSSREELNRYLPRSY